VNRHVLKLDLEVESETQPRSHREGTDRIRAKTPPSSTYSNLGDSPLIVIFVGWLSLADWSVNSPVSSYLKPKSIIMGIDEVNPLLAVATIVSWSLAPDSSPCMSPFFLSMISHVCPCKC
jgi:hypothetical protein